MSKDFLGFDISKSNFESLSTEVENALKNEEGGLPLVVSCINPHSIVVSMRDSRFLSALKSGPLLICDGVGVSLFTSSSQRDRKIERITGYQFFHLVSRNLDRKSGKMFFLGSSNETLVALHQSVSNHFPGIKVGCFSPPYRESFSEEESEMMIHAVNDFKPDVLWVGMTAPKQEKWVDEFKHQLDVKIIGNVGAVFDYVAGTESIAPQYFRNMGLEWFYRLANNPKRMLPRLYSSIYFLYLIIFRKKNFAYRLTGKRP